MEEIKFTKKLEKKNPLDEANILSKIFFCWFLPYFVKGHKSKLKEDDLQYRESHESKLLGDQLEAAWQLEVETKILPSLGSVIIKVFRVELIFGNLIILIAESFRFVQPVLISRLVSFYDLAETKEVQNKIYLYASLIVLAQFLNLVFNQFYRFQVSQMGMKMRISCSWLIYRKTLKLGQNTLVNTTIGQIVNLISNDVKRFDLGFYNFYHCWLGPLMALLVLYLTYISFGVMCLFGMFLLLGCIPLQLYVGKKSSDFRLKTAICTDERIRLMNEVLTGIQVIKMYAWEKRFSKLIKIARLREIKFVRKLAMIKGILITMSACNNKICIAIAIIVYVVTGNILTSTYVFTITSYYKTLNSFNTFFPMAVSQLSELRTSIKRIQTFLTLNESCDKNISVFTEKYSMNNQNDIKLVNCYEKKEIGIKLSNVSAKWVKTHNENNLENVSMNTNSNDLTAIVGPVGSGKSSLLQVILKELPALGGTVEVYGRVSYASQEPWLFESSIRENIIFGEHFDQMRYDDTIRACALERDLTILPYGDKTRIGERGITLSGGQKARVNLARAIYKDADIYLLDDPFSAVDAHVGKQIFKICISQFLSNKCVVLVTHQLQYLENVKNIFVLENGKIKSAKSFENCNNVINKFLTDEEEEDKILLKKEVETLEFIENNIIKAPDIEKEGKKLGKVTRSIYKSYFRAGGHLIKICFIAVTFLMSQALLSLVEYFVAIWVNTKQPKDQNWASNLLIYNEIKNSTNGLVSYNDFIKSVFTGRSTVYIYGALVVLAFLVTVVRSQYFYLWCLKVSTVLHNKMFNNLIACPLHFFNTNASGRILNRFLYDIGNTDDLLPQVILETMQIGLNLLAICVVIGTLSPWTFIPSLAIIILFYVLRRLFLETSRELQRFEAVARSPVYSHLTATFQGLTTIRAFKAQEILTTKFNELMNVHSGTFFMLLGANRTFNFWLDFFCVIYTIVVLTILLFIKKEMLGGNMGLALTQLMSLTEMLQWGIRQWSEFENKMISVERIQEYIELPREIDVASSKLPESWPTDGEIIFKRLSLRYSTVLPYSLKNLSFTIKSKEKIGVVGRTGAGKSSIIQAIFRLTYIDGNIIIDGIDTQHISLNNLRSKISIIPQEAVLFSGTIRKNLDPFDEFSNEILWSALEEVELKSTILDLPDGLDNVMAEGGVNFSVGQRQLFCLARAIIRQNKILILDEATANIDLQTDSLIQTTIRKKFVTCTVITVAHRLNTIIDSDKVLVMDEGEIKEYGIPHLLLNNKDSIFYSLLMQTGPSVSKKLLEEARIAYTLKYISNTVEL